MGIIYGTKARLFIRNKTTGKLEDVGTASFVETEMTDADLAPYLTMLKSFEIEFTCTLRWIDPWALALPPAGMMPMYN